jgi:hypothetical protein
MVQDRNCLQHMIDMAEDDATSKASEIVDIAVIRSTFRSNKTSPFWI